MSLSVKPVSESAIPVVGANTTRLPPPGREFAVNLGVRAQQVMRLQGHRPPGAGVYEAPALVIASNASINGHTHGGGVVLGTPRAFRMSVVVQNWQGQPPSSMHPEMLFLCVALWLPLLEAQDLGCRAVGLCRRLVFSSRAAWELMDDVLNSDELPECAWCENDPALNNLCALAATQVLCLRRYGVDLQLVWQPRGYTVLDGDGLMEKHAHQLAQQVDVANPDTFTHTLDAGMITSGICEPRDYVALISTNPPLRNFWEEPGIVAGRMAARQRIMRSLMTPAAAHAVPAAPATTAAPATAAAPATPARDDDSAAPQAE